MPLSSPILGKNGKWISEVHVPAGSAICISLRGCNAMKELWGEDADEWKPERWLSPLPDAVLNANIPGVFPNLYVSHVLHIPEGCVNLAVSI